MSSHRQRTIRIPSYNGTNRMGSHPRLGVFRVIYPPKLEAVVPLFTEVDTLARRHA